MSLKFSAGAIKRVKFVEANFACRSVLQTANQGKRCKNLELQTANARAWIFF